MNFIFELDKRNYIKRRESFDLEYKQSFQGGDNLIKYAKSLVGMANNKGGQIIFGIQDSPHTPIGISTKKWIEIDPRKIDRIIREYFSQEIEWSQQILEFDGKEFGQLAVFESENKPIICSKNKDNLLREGAIYYRYRAETKEIEFAELKNLLDKEKEKEKLMWMQHIQKIAQIGPNNVSLFDTYKGEISVGNGKILLDKSIVDKLNFIQKGKFVESEEEGLPTLRLVGDIEGLVDPSIVVESDKLYPLLAKDIKDRLNLNPHDLQCIIWKLEIKGDKRYHTEIRLGEKSNPIHKYSEALVPVINRLLKKGDFLRNCKSDYSKFQKEQQKLKKKK
ncbi:helix-turn-helix domain-containing protein [Flavihumibacter stibioxidans]|uniref:Schlafen AlbA-2 domain-containing protein n=1 Tax=Flavihumibacter stibioxidans TaxID=1834163 RepID=A0ABR7M715_9BACT|nr:ATP-binding protein [Flavihumibacter stibioxidans]MBC6490706.1 hypothetical protein [Flavihumibacter stibioxidans]